MFSYLFFSISHFFLNFSTQLPAIFKSGNISENKIIETNSYSKSDDERQFSVRTSQSVSQLQPSSSAQQPVVLSSLLLPDTPHSLSSSSSSSLSSSSLSSTSYITVPTSMTALPTLLSISPPPPPLPLPLPLSLSLSLGSARVRSKGRGGSEKFSNNDPEIRNLNFSKSLDRAHLRGTDAAKNFLEEHSLLLHRYDNIIVYFLRGFLSTETLNLLIDLFNFNRSKKKKKFYFMNRFLLLWKTNFMICLPTFIFDFLRRFILSLLPFFFLIFRAVCDGEFSLKSSAAVECSIALSKLLGRAIFMHKLHPDIQRR